MIPVEITTKLAHRLKQADTDYAQLAKDWVVPASAAAGGLYGATRAYRSAQPIPSDEETRDQNALRHRREAVAELRGYKDPRGPLERLRNRLLDAEDDYAAYAKDHPIQATLLGGAVGAGAGTLAGYGLRGAMEDSLLFGATTPEKVPPTPPPAAPSSTPVPSPPIPPKVSSARYMTDVLGLSRKVLVKKAQYLNLPISKVAELEVLAATLARQPHRNPVEQQFLWKMAELQEAVSPSSLLPQTLNTKGSFGELLMEKDLDRKALAAEEEPPPQESSPIAPESQRQLSGEISMYFGGDEKSASVFKKTSAVFGAQLPDETVDMEKSDAQRVKWLRAWGKQKAKEEATGRLKSTLVGAGLGAGVYGPLGYFAGAGSSRRGGMAAAAAAAGGLSGGALGYILGDADDKVVQWAKKFPKKNDAELRRDLAKMLSGQPDQVL